MLKKTLIILGFTLMSITTSAASTDSTTTMPHPDQCQSAVATTTVGNYQNQNFTSTLSAKQNEQNACNIADATFTLAATSKPTCTFTLKEGARAYVYDASVKRWSPIQKNHSVELGLSDGESAGKYSLHFYFSSEEENPSVSGLLECNGLAPATATSQ